MNELRDKVAGKEATLFEGAFCDLKDAVIANYNLAVAIESKTVKINDTLRPFDEPKGERKANSIIDEIRVITAQVRDTNAILEKSFGDLRDAIN